MTDVPRLAVYAGHGGSDPGAVALGRMEKNLTLSVMLAATAVLRGWGYTVINNRTTDVDRSITRDANLANDNRVDALIEIHFNSNMGTPGTGTEVFRSIRDTGRGQALASTILTRIVALGFANRGVKTQVNAQGQDAFAILRLANMPAVLVECAFMNNPNDMARLNINTMGQAIAEGIRDTFPISGGGSGGGDGGMPPFPGTLIRVGDRGESVRQIQSCLNRVSLRHPTIQRLNEDGIFGPRTFDAVTTFQRIFGLSPDGIVGPLTWGRLVQECPAAGGGGGSGGAMSTYPGTPLRVGSRGDSVRQIQHCLNHVSQPCSRRLAEDGVFGPLTEAAVITFQRLFDLTPDGVVGPITWGRLSQECGSGSAVRAYVQEDGEDALPAAAEKCQVISPPMMGFESGVAGNHLLPLLLLKKLAKR